VNFSDSEIGIRKTTLYLGHCALPTRHGEFTVHFFRDLANERIAMAIVFGSLSGPAPLLARVHSSCLTSECLMGRDCDCAEQLDGALATMANAGNGVLFYLMQEGRGAGLTAKARDRMLVQASGNRITTFEAYAQMGLPPDLRRYEAIASMSKLLGIQTPLRLLTNNPDKAAAVEKVLAEEQIEVRRTEAIQGPVSAFNSDYLSAKLDSGHALDRASKIEAAMPPERVRSLPPRVVPGASHLIRTAGYFLPIALPIAEPGMHGDRADRVVDWFRLDVFLDCRTALESIVLAHRDFESRDLTENAVTLLAGDERQPSVTMTLLDRLPMSSSPGRDALTRRLVAIRHERRGAVAVHFDDRDRAER
jgi:GTP cyclohydrolase II